MQKHSTKTGILKFQAYHNNIYTTVPSLKVQLDWAYILNFYIRDKIGKADSLQVNLYANQSNRLFSQL